MAPALGGLAGTTKICFVVEKRAIISLTALPSSWRPGAGAIRGVVLVYAIRYFTLCGVSDA